jgi:hypothetical protein
MVDKTAVDIFSHKCSSFWSVIWLVHCALYGLSTKGLSFISPQELKEKEENLLV